MELKTSSKCDRPHVDLERQENNTWLVKTELDWIWKLSWKFTEDEDQKIRKQIKLGKNWASRRLTQVDWLKKFGHGEMHLIQRSSDTSDEESGFHYIYTDGRPVHLDTNMGLECKILPNRLDETQLSNNDSEIKT